MSEVKGSPNNKRKMDDSAEQKDEKVAKKANIGYQKEDITNRLEAKLLGWDEINAKIKEKKKEIKQKYAEDFKEIDRRFKEIENEKADIEFFISTEKENATRKIVSSHPEVGGVDGYTVNELLQVIKEDTEFFYLEESIDNEEFLVGCLSRILKNGLHEDEPYNNLGVKKDERVAFRQFVKEEIEIVKAKAIVPMIGKPRGVDENLQFRVKPGATVRIEAYPNAILSQAENDNLIAMLHGFPVPVENDKECGVGCSWVSAEIEVDVWVVRLKDAKKKQE